MERLTSMPFGRRRVSAAQLAACSHNAARAAPIDKWKILRDLTESRRAWNLSDRDLTVLSALLSCHPRRELDDPETLIVYPSNATLSARAHGMAESTLRRHLAALVASGLILRHDSPNGKRYAARSPDGSVLRAFGFDLAPLLHRAPAIAASAEASRALALRLKRLREEVVLRFRDCTKLLDHAAPNPDITEDLAEAKRALRRRLDEAALQALARQSARILAALEAALPGPEAPEASGTDGQNERHIQDQTQKIDSDLTRLMPPAPGSPRRDNPSLTLPEVVAACPDIQYFAGEPLRRWSDLVATAQRAGAMLGITPTAWHEARSLMGATETAVTVACLLQSADRIKSPAGYLRTLTKQAKAGRFTCVLMVHRLMQALTAVNFTRAGSGS